MKAPATCEAIEPQHEVEGGLPGTHCLSSVIPLKPLYSDSERMRLLGTERWKSIERPWPIPSELEFLHFLELCSYLRDKVARMSSSRQEVEHMLSLWIESGRQHPIELRGSVLSGRLAHLEDFVVWSLRVWDEYFLANADVLAPAPGAVKELESGCRLSSPPKGPIGKPDPGQEPNPKDIGDDASPYHDMMILQAPSSST